MSPSKTKSKKKSTKEPKSNQEKKDKPVKSIPSKKPDSEEKEKGPPSRYVAVRARMPVRISREAKAHATELKKSGQLNEAESSGLASRIPLQEAAEPSLAYYGSHPLIVHNLTCHIRGYSRGGQQPPQDVEISQNRCTKTADCAL